MTQTKNGFIPNSFQTPNLLIDRLLPLLELSEFAVLMFVVRHILGWDDVENRCTNLSLTAIEHGHRGQPGCGLSRPIIQGALQQLEGFGLLERVGKPSSRRGQAWRLVFEEDAVKWDAMRTRRDERQEKNHQRTRQATQISSKKRKAKKELSVRPTYQCSGTSHVPIEEPIGTSDVPPIGTSHVPIRKTREIPLKTDGAPIGDEQPASTVSEIDSAAPNGARRDPSSGRKFPIGATVYYVEEPELGQLDILAGEIVRYTPKKVWVRFGESERCLFEHTLRAEKPALKRNTDRLEDGILYHVLKIGPGHQIGRRTMKYIRDVKSNLLTTYPGLTAETFHAAAQRKHPYVPTEIPKVVKMVGEYLEQRNGKEPLVKLNPPDPHCPRCGGAGLLWPDVPPDDPAYNDPHPCSCCIPKEAERAATR